MLEHVDKHYFEPLLNSVYRLVLNADEHILLELIEVKGLNIRAELPTEWGKPPVKAEREQFSIVFRGPMQPILPQGMYRMEHPSAETLENLFLVPIAQDSKGTIYESVFT